MVQVRDVCGADELRACQDLQRKAWGITEDGYVVPVATMAAVQKVGGVILGAFLEGDGNNLLIGFAFAFLGKLNGRLILWSQLTGVHPAHQSTGVGRMLKLEQRRRAKEMDLPAVAWAFDPLQANNAAFNLGVLGATSRIYEVDMYGSRSDALNVGLATDRLIVEWGTSGDPAGRTSMWPDGVELISSEAAARPAVRDFPASAQHLSIEVPARLSEVKTLGTAGEWQAALRDAFQTAFGRGYQVVGFTRTDRARYLLELTR